MTDNVDGASAKASSLNAPKKTILERLRDEISKEVSNPELEISVPGRDGVKLIVDTNISAEDIRVWSRKSTNKKTKDFNSLKQSCLVIAAKTEGIIFDGEEVLEDDQPLSFRDKTIQDMVDELTPEDAVRDFIGNDAVVFEIAGTILDSAGYSSDGVLLDVEDREDSPTRP